jgi:hypothetical protein
VGKKEYLELELTLDDLLDFPDNFEDVDVEYSDSPRHIEIEDSDVLSNNELEESMRDIHGINSMKDLRPDDYKGFSVNVLNLFNMIRKRKG